MKIHFDHINGFGKISNYEVIVNCSYGILEKNESETRALQEGWIPWKGKWYNERSTRIDLTEFKPTKTSKKISKKIKTVKGSLIDKLKDYQELYTKYCLHNSFQRNINLSSFEGCDVIEYWTDKLNAISIYKIFETNMVAYQFIWDYEDPKLSLGSVAQMFECDFAKDMNCEYVYLLGGYEKCCEYKSNYHGFQFWTGKEWSSDIELYKILVNRDEKIEIINYDV
jgi:arginyl-tRNA--protein-N-Asp/Glu arginylyltransferase